MTSPVLRDALAVARLNRIKQRSARAQVRAEAQRTEERIAAAGVAAAAEGVQMLQAVACTCILCQLRRAQQADEGAETAPASIKAH